MVFCKSLLLADTKQGILFIQEGDIYGCSVREKRKGEEQWNQQFDLFLYFEMWVISICLNNFHNN